MRSAGVGGQGGSPASRLRSGTMRTVMSRRWLVMPQFNDNLSGEHVVSPRVTFLEQKIECGG
jgi:hypothetical protein